MQTRRDADTGRSNADPGDGDAPADGDRRARAIGGVLVAATVAVAVAARFVTRSDLWLDEALSVNIARLAAGDIGEALRHDGHPPLYYLLLHSWTEAFGAGDVAVRALSGVLSIATLPLAWLAGRRYAGRAGAVVYLVLVAASPFAVRYATEARMYALVMLLVTAGWLAVRRAVERPSAGRLATVAVVAGLLLLSHYWAFYLLAATAAVLGWHAWRGRGEPTAPAARRVIVALLAGGVLFLPWLGGFLEQARNTGTPWGRPDRPATVVMVSLTDFGGGPYAEAQVLGIVLAALAVVGLAGRSLDRMRLELDLRTRPDARPEAAVVALTVGLAVAAGYATGSAFASRYMAAVLPLLLLVAALGVTRLAHPAVRTGVLATVVVLGLVGMGRNVVFDRTEAGEVAAVVNAEATPGDVVAFCPDQLGPATDRYLTVGVDAVVYPDLAGPARVDWVDYRDRVDAGDPAAFAEQLVERAGTSTIWLVWFGGYITHDDDCEAVATALGARRPAAIASEAGEAFEPMWLYRFPAS